MAPLSNPVTKRLLVVIPVLVLSVLEEILVKTAFGNVLVVAVKLLVDINPVFKIVPVVIPVLILIVPVEILVVEKLGTTKVPAVNVVI